MTRRFGLFALLALGTLLVTTGLANAERVPSRRTVTLPSTGARPDITVPYTTDGRSTLMGANGVSPRILSGPGLGTNQVRPVYNLPFYGATQSFWSGSFGAMPRRGNSLRPGR
jgi:hypothetical protein